jgi:hypothetical protein
MHAWHKQRRTVTNEFTRMTKQIPDMAPGNLIGKGKHKEKGFSSP